MNAKVHRFEFKWKRKKKVSDKMDLLAVLAPNIVQTSLDCPRLCSSPWVGKFQITYLIAFYSCAKH